jgi:L-ascorbate 6-phosphate lactonase
MTHFFSLTEASQVKVPEGNLAVWPLGGGSLLIRSDEALVLLDPFLTNWSSEEWIRRFPPMVKPQEIDKCDAILVTHEHEDHCDPESIRPILQRTNARLFAPKPSMERLYAHGVNDQLIRNGNVVSPGEEYRCLDLTIRIVETIDPLSEGPVGYSLGTQTTSLLMLGDSLYREEHFTHLLRESRPNAVFIALGKNPPDVKYYFSLDDLKLATRSMGNALIVPIHWDLWTKTFLDPFSECDLDTGNVKLIRRGTLLMLPMT